MTRKDFELIARVIRELPWQTSREQVAERFAANLVVTNDSFNPARFIKAATENT